MANQDFPELTPEEYAAFEQDMAGMYADEGSSYTYDELEGPVAQMFRDDIKSQKGHERDDDKELIRRFESGELTATEAVEMLSKGILTEREATQEASGWVQDGLSAADDSKATMAELLEQDEEIFRENGVEYGGPVAAYVDSQLSSEVRQGETLEERKARDQSDYEGYVQEILTEAASARLDAKMARGENYELFDESTMEALKARGYDDVEALERESREADARKTRPADGGAAGGMGGQRIVFDAAKPASDMTAGQLVEAAKEKTTEAPHVERNADRLPRSNNHTPTGTTVYNRAIPNDSWSFDEFDSPDCPGGMGE